MKQKHFGNVLVLLILTVTLFSFAALSSGLEFKFSDKRKIVYTFSDKSGQDTVVLVDENQKEHVLIQGTLSALATSTDNIKDNNVDLTISAGTPKRNLIIKKLFKCDLPIAIVDNQFYAFDSMGVKYPLLNLTSKDWPSEFSTKDVPVGESSIKVVGKTNLVQGEKYANTELTFITYPLGMGASRTFKTSKEKPFHLQDFVIGTKKENADYGFVLVDSISHWPLKDASNELVKAVMAGEMTPYPEGIKLESKLALNVSTQIQTAAEELNPLLPIPELTDEQKQAELKRIRAKLEDSIVGQPEVVERFYKMAVKRYMYGHNQSRPEQATLMGGPGTGKDTTVHAYVDAINGEEGAWQNNNHMYDMPVVKTEADLWSLQGSATGHVGSETLSPFISFLIKHSGGKYKEVAVRDPRTNKISKTYVELNKDWKEGQVLEGYFPPSKGVVFVNESQHWSKKAKDQFLKKALDGTITLNNPDVGESVISIPVTWIFATNEGEGLVIPRKANGQAATSKPLTIEQAFRNWQSAHNDENRLDEEMRKTNGNASGGKSEDAEGNSDAFISRQTNKILYRPLFPDSLRIIAQMKLEILKKKWIGSYDLTWNQDFVATIQEFMYNAEKNGRPIEDKVEKMVETPLLDAVSDGHLTKGANKTLALSFKKNSDNTLSLVTEGDGANLSLQIKYSEKDKLVALKTDAELERTIDLPRRLKKHVFGAEVVADALGRDTLVSDEASSANLTPENATEAAHNIMFLGPSSVGKTEMAKALGLEHLGSRDDVKTYDFGQVTNKEHMKEKILGSRDGYNNPVASDYMMEFDAHGGHVINVLDEAANAPADALKSLYDILREPVVTTFSDSRPRVMSHVWNIFTGNAGEEWYKDIPADLPYNQQMAAMQEIYKGAMANPGFRRRTLEKYFSSAFIARIGESNIYFFSPMTFKSIREISQLKLSQQLKDIQTAKNRRNWDVNFASMNDYSKTLEMIEAEGFVVKEQGASLDRFVKQTFGTDLRAFLLTNKIPHQAEVTLVKTSDTEMAQAPGFVNYKVLVNGKDNSLNFQIAKRVKEKSLAQNEEDQILTAYHEAGHELVRHVLFGDRYKSLRISIIPGVAEINDHMVVYEGIASYNQEKKFSYTKEAILRELAVKLAGTAAQELASRNFIHDAGKSNDTERASNLAQYAILKWGLSDIWGSEAVPTELSINQFLATFSESKRQRYEAAMKDMLKQARDMADAVLLTNMATLKPLGAELAKRGEMVSADLEKFYESNKMNIDVNGFDKLLRSSALMKNEKDKWVDDTPNEGRPLNASLSKFMMRPASVANIDRLVAEQKAAEIAKVVLPDDTPITRIEKSEPTMGAAGNSSNIVQTCEMQLELLRMPRKAN